MSKKILRQDLNIPPKLILTKAVRGHRGIYPSSNLSYDRTRIAKAHDIDPSTETDNIPLVGYRIRFDYGLGCWVATDPRGWQASISNLTADAILSRCRLICGMITSPMVWIRAGKAKTMDLFSTQWAEYPGIASFSELTYAAATVSAPQIGDRVTLKNGVTGRYRGRFYTYGPVCHEYRMTENKLIYEPQEYGRRHGVLRDDGILFMTPSASVLTKEPTATPMTLAESVDELKTIHCDKITTLAHGAAGGYSRGGAVTHLSHTEGSAKVMLVPVARSSMAGVFSGGTMPENMMLRSPKHSYLAIYPVRAKVSGSLATVYPSGYSGALTFESHSEVAPNGTDPVTVDRLIVDMSHRISSVGSGKPLVFDLNDPDTVLYSVSASIDGVPY